MKNETFYAIAFVTFVVIFFWLTAEPPICHIIDDKCVGHWLLKEGCQETGFLYITTISQATQSMIEDWKKVEVLTIYELKFVKLENSPKQRNYTMNSASILLSIDNGLFF